jgi:ATP-dependent DNA helicase RecG
LPNGLSLEDLKSEHNSRPRNPKIAEACFKAGYIDTWGRGTLKIINSCKEAELPEPEIKEASGGVSVTIFKITNPEESGEIRKEFGKNSERIRKEFGKEVARAFDVIVAHPEFTSEQIAEEVGKTSRTVEKYIAKLKEAGIIERKGPKLGGHWEIMDSK